MPFRRFRTWTLVRALLVITILAAGVQAESMQPASAQSNGHQVFLPLVIRQTGGISSPANMIVVDHRSVELFERIPEQYIQAAANLRMFFMDRSVGQNIYEGLECLRYPTDEAAPNACRRWTHPVPEFSVDPETHGWSRPGGYDSSKWVYMFWPNGCDMWYDKVRCFIEYIQPRVSQYDVVSYQFSYLEVGTGSTIADSPGGFFYNNPNRYDVYEFEAFASTLPPQNKLTFYWTTSLARSIGTIESETFNNQTRQYAAANNKILFDVADILSHDPYGNPCFDSISGTYKAICRHYTTESPGGHLGSVSAGKIRVAKAYWVLMARLAGWNP